MSAATPDFEERPLRSILGTVRISQDAVRHSKETMMVTDHQRLECTGVPLSCPTGSTTRSGPRKEQPAVERSAIETQRQWLIDLYADRHIGREEFVGRMRALEATLAGGLLAEAQRYSSDMTDEPRDVVTMPRCLSSAFQGTW